MMLITSRQKRLSLQNPVLSLRYSDIDIKMTPSEKILGVHVDDNLMWNNHFKHVSKKISSYLWLLSKIRSYLSVEPGLENCTRPLVFTSGSLVRASGNCHLLARQYE